MKIIAFAGSNSKNSINRQVINKAASFLSDNEVEILDLDYEEDSSAETDGNFVLTASKGIVEIQATAEQKPYNKSQFLKLLELAEIGTQQIFNIQRKALGLD